MCQRLALAHGRPTDEGRSGAQVSRAIALPMVCPSVVDGVRIARAGWVRHRSGALVVGTT